MNRIKVKRKPAREAADLSGKEERSRGMRARPSARTPPVAPPEFLNVRVRPLREPDLPEADRIFHWAFGTQLGLRDPMQFWPDRDYVRTRYHADPTSALGVEVKGELVGSNFVTHWGSVGLFGPLTIRPDYWNHGFGQHLLEATMPFFGKWQTRQLGLFTFAESAKHTHLYQKFGFWPRFLTTIMSSPVHRVEPAGIGRPYSELTPASQAETLKACRELTGAIFEGLDVGREVRATAVQGLGDTVLLWEAERLVAFAVCHCGARTEAGRDSCYVKFGAVRPGAEAPATFDRLLDACESFAAARGLSRLEAGVNLARYDACQRMLARGFRTDIQGVAMHKPNEPGYSRPDVYVIDDWR